MTKRIKYSDMSKEYRSENSREEFKNLTDKGRKAGDSGALQIFNEKGGKKNSAFEGDIDEETPGATAFQKGNERFKGTERDSYKPQFGDDYDPEAPKTREQLDDYNLQATGVSKGQQRLSRGDLRGLLDAGYSREDLVDYVNDLGGPEGKDKKTEGFAGRGAQNLVKKWTDNLNGKTDASGNDSVNGEGSNSDSSFTRTERPLKNVKGNTPADKAIRRNNRNYVDTDPDNLINTRPFYMKDLSTVYANNTLDFSNLPYFNLNNMEFDNFNKQRDSINNTKED